MKAIFDRLKEPSTWAGLGTIAMLVGVPVAHVDAVNGVVAAVCAAVAVFSKEKGGQ